MREDGNDDIGTTRFEVGSSLDALSVDELKAQIVDLHAEIARISLEIEKKNASKSAAADVFKT